LWLSLSLSLGDARPWNKMLKSWLYIISIVFWNNFISQPFFFFKNIISPFFSYLVFRNHPLNVINSFWLLFPFAKLFRKLKCESVHDMISFWMFFEITRERVFFKTYLLKLRNSTFDQKSLCVCPRHNMMRFLTNWYIIKKTLKSIFIEKWRYNSSEDALSESNNFILLC